jgi:hypothetical protein
MKNILLFLWSLVLLTACRKKEEKPIVTHYPQRYTATYYSEYDSVVATASLVGTAAYYLDGVPVTMTLNGVEADSYLLSMMLYTWQFKGLKDVVFKFLTHGNTLVNTIKATDIKIYEFANLPDTISITSWKSIQLNGPVKSEGEKLYVQLYFPDNSMYERTTDSNVHNFPEKFLENKPLGKTQCRVHWYGKEMNLQMSDGNAGGLMRCISILEKQVVLVP